MINLQKQSYQCLVSNFMSAISSFCCRHILYVCLITIAFQATAKNAEDIYDQMSQLYQETNYKEIQTLLSSIEPLEQYEADSALKADILRIAADALYHQKRYKAAIPAYERLANFLNLDKDNNQERLGDTFNRIAQTYKRMKDPSLSSLYYEKSLAFYKAINKVKAIARTHHTLGEAERRKGNLVLALEHALASLEHHKESNDLEGRAKATLGAGIIYRLIGRYEKSLEYVLLANEYYKELNDRDGIVKSSNETGHIYTRLQQFEDAGFFYQQTVDQAQYGINQNAYATALRELAVINANAKQYAIGLDMAQRAYLIFREQNDIAKSAQCLRIIGNIYRAQEDIEKAIDYYERSMEQAKLANNLIFLVKAQIPLGEALLGIDNERAKRLLESAIDLTDRINENAQMLNAYRVLKLLAKSEGDINKAFEYAEKQISLSIIVQKQRNAQDLAMAKTNLQTYKMELELNALRDRVTKDQLTLSKKNSEIEIAKQAKRISELEAVKNKYASLALAALVVVCLILILLSYRRFRASKQRNSELEVLAETDPLTNCFNRRSLVAALEAQFSSALISSPLCVVMIDIDHFKHVNDTYGHSAGDKVIINVGNIIKAQTKETDLVARYGGEEFCVLLIDTHLERALQIAESIRQTIETSEVENIKVTCSFGISERNIETIDGDALIELADSALYRSKATGRNKVTSQNASNNKTTS